MGVDKDQASIMPFGLLELDGRGTVVHYSSAREQQSAGRDWERESIVGRNFFDDVVPVLPVKEFKDRFLRFMSSGDSVQRFTIRFPFEQQEVRVQIMLAHITERTDRRSERLALVRLMPENNAACTERAVA
jgi:photoactive yellow protein